MSLLNRIALSNGNKQRKVQANLVLRSLDQAKIDHWNKDLQAEIRRRNQKRSPLSVKP